MPLQATVLHPIPSPDRLLFAAEGVVLLTGEEGALRNAARARLEAAGWTVVPFALDAEEAMETALQAIVESRGRPVGLLHLEPPAETEALFPQAARTRLRQLFLLAGRLHPFLTKAEPRPFFVVATQMDGQLGMSGRGFTPLAGGYGGLTKTLALEWPAVFCRTVDFAPDLPPDTVADLLLDELHDPDLRLREVARNAQGRFTRRAAPKEDGR